LRPIHEGSLFDSHLDFFIELGRHVESPDPSADEVGESVHGSESLHWRVIIGSPTQRTILLTQ
jgi:hypothetical protein